MKNVAVDKVLKLLKEPMLEKFIIEMKNDYETANLIAKNSNIKFSDPWKAVYHYRKHGENFNNKMPTEIKFYFGEIAKNIFKNKTMIEIKTMVSFFCA